LASEQEIRLVKLWVTVLVILSADLWGIALVRALEK
jgi:hypothetical protein